MVVPSHHSSFLLVGDESHLSLIFIFPPLVLSSRHSSFLLVGMDLICLPYSFFSCVVSSLFFPTGGGRISLVSHIYLFFLCNVSSHHSSFLLPPFSLPSASSPPPFLLFCIIQGFGSVFNWVRIQPKISIRTQKTLYPDPSYFLTLSGKKLLHNYKIFSFKEVDWKKECCKSH